MVKLDLHTHIWEAFNFQPPSLDTAEKVIAQIKLKGIDGIAITDHHNKDWAFEFRELVEQNFPGSDSLPTEKTSSEYASFLAGIPYPPYEYSVY